MLQNKLEQRVRYFSLILFLAFLIKYNYLMFHIFQTPSVISLGLRNIIFAYFYINFIEPLLVYKRSRQRLFILVIIFTTFFFSNYFYNRYFGNFLSVSDIMSAEGLGTFSLYEVLFRHIIRYRDVVFILDIIILGFLGFSYLPDFKFIKDPQRIFKNAASDKKMAMLIIVLLIVVQLFTASLIFNGAQPNRLYQIGSGSFVSVHGLSSFYAVDSYSYLQRQKQATPELEDMPYYRRREQLSDIEKLPENTNVIMIQVESLDERIINFTQEGKEVVPFLNSFKEESIYFEDFYAQKVNASFDADLSVLTSLYPVNRSYVYRDIDLSNFASLPKLLNERNYQTLAFHNNNKEFFNRGEAYPALGFDNFYSKEDFSEEIFVLPEERSLGVNDYDFFNQAAEIIIDAEQQDEPFLAFMISLTCHTPFNFYPEDGVDDFEGVNSNFVLDYFKSINFTDSALENFFQKLEQAGILDNTLVVIYSDHESEVDTPEYSSDRDFNLWRNIKKPDHVPLFISHPDLESQISNNPGTTTDLSPTVLDLLGFEELPQQFVGRSLFLDKEEPLLFLDETPKILYKDQLFVEEMGVLNKVGYLEDKEKEVEIDQQRIAEMEGIIRYMRRIFGVHEGEIFREVE
ncbi:LTA synthase family protein [Halanaerobium hydrogeniformans]|uniref:Sulfatase n=1 Tax=Halanaerobium hydrogeniformans TaxID=656519 RepID=E4RMS0_HALHG|nr:LTA synthase family protein [Halanaerobium hydrogeniformans]ADQ14137.1 sulfatase [Halanaerobium hydrogeniformans]